MTQSCALRRAALSWPTAWSTATLCWPLWTAAWAPVMRCARRHLSNARAATKHSGNSARLHPPRSTSRRERAQPITTLTPTCAGRRSIPKEPQVLAGRAPCSLVRCSCAPSVHSRPSSTRCGMQRPRAACAGWPQQIATHPTHSAGHSELPLSTLADADLLCDFAPSFSRTLSPLLQLPAPSVSDARGDHDAHTPPFTLLRGHGVTLRNGRVHLPQGHVLLVQGGVTLQNMQVQSSGAHSPGTLKRAPLVFVSQGDVTMERVTVGANREGHGVAVGVCGTLHLRRCDLSNNHCSGLLVRGTTAEVTARKCRFGKNGQDGSCVLEGASATFEACEFAGNHGTGLRASHVATQVGATLCTAKRNGYGFVAQGGAALHLTLCRASDNAHGLHVTHVGTKSHATGCAFAHHRTGVHVSHGAEVWPRPRLLRVTHVSLGFPVLQKFRLCLRNASS